MLRVLRKNAFHLAVGFLTLLSVTMIVRYQPSLAEAPLNQPPEPAYSYEIKHNPDAKKNSPFKRKTRSDQVVIQYLFQYRNKVATCQKSGKTQKNIVRTLTSEHMDPNMCNELCSKSAAPFAAITRGDTCNCLKEYGSDIVDKYSKCSTACAGQPKMMCGSETHSFTFKVDSNSDFEVDATTKKDSNDKDQSIKIFSPWTSFYGFDKFIETRVRRRFSGCNEIDFKNNIVCTAKIETDSHATEEALDGAGSRYIGCFTDLSFTNTSLFKIKYFEYASAINKLYADKCVKQCEEYSTYAILLKKGCYCSNSLGLSLPMDGCSDGFGAAVFSTEEIKDNQIQLKFEKETKRVKIVLIAHYRGGSTFTLEMFNGFKNALSVYEPDIVLGMKWPGVATYWTEEERAHVFLNQILPMWLDCRQDELPAEYFRLMLSPNVDLPGMDVWFYCRSKTKAYNRDICWKFLKERCLLSSVTSLKVVRILAPDSIEKAVKNRPDINFVYLARDPRGTMASRIKLFAWWSEDVVARLEDLCTEMVLLETIFKSGLYKNAMITYYEEQAADIINTTNKLYRQLGLTMTPDIHDKLLFITGQLDEKSKDGHADKDPYDIVRTDSRNHINGWVDKLDNKLVIEAEQKESCSILLQKFSQHYLPLTQIKDRS